MVDGVRVSNSPSFGLFALSHPLRRRCLALVQHPWFDAATVAVILFRHGLAEQCGGSVIAHTGK